MYAFVYVDPETIPVEYHFTDTKTFVVNYNKISTPGTVSKRWIGFSYIHSEDCELYLSFDDKSFKNNETTHPTIKLIFFAKILWLLRKHFWWYEFNWWCNLSDGSDQTCKNYIQSKNIFSAWHKATHTGNYNKQWLEQIYFQILRDIIYGNFLFKVNFLSILPKPVELSYNWISSIKSHIFTLDCLISQKTDPLKSLLHLQRHMMKNKFLMFQSCTFNSRIKVIVCYVYYRMHFTSLVIKLLMIVLKMKLPPR